MDNENDLMARSGCNDLPEPDYDINDCLRMSEHLAAGYYPKPGWYVVYHKRDGKAYLTDEPFSTELAAQAFCACHYDPKAFVVEVE